jgi:hypothetical protein
MTAGAPIPVISAPGCQREQTDEIAFESSNRARCGTTTRDDQVAPKYRAGDRGPLCFDYRVEAAGRRRTRNKWQCTVWPLRHSLLVPPVEQSFQLTGFRRFG